MLTHAASHCGNHTARGRQGENGRENDENTIYRPDPVNERLCPHTDAQPYDTEDHASNTCSQHLGSAI